VSFLIISFRKTPIKKSLSASDIFLTMSTPHVTSLSPLTPHGTLPTHIETSLLLSLSDEALQSLSNLLAEDLSDYALVEVCVEPDLSSFKMSMI
jgi:hypothetical protein